MTESQGLYHLASISLKRVDCQARNSQVPERVGYPTRRGCPGGVGGSPRGKTSPGFQRTHRGRVWHLTLAGNYSQLISSTSRGDPIGTCEVLLFPLPAPALLISWNLEEAGQTLPQSRPGRESTTTSSPFRVPLPCC